MNSITFLISGLTSADKRQYKLGLCTTIPIPMRFVSSNVVFPASYMKLW